MTHSKSMQPNPWLLAQNSNAEKFFAQYRPEMATWRPNNNPLVALWGALSNNDITARALIAGRLLDDGAEVGLVSGEGANLLHVLFSKREHDFVAEAPVLRRLLECGADINGYSPKWGRPLHVLMDNYSIGDEELGPFYDVIFAQPGIDWDVPVSLKSQVEKRTLRELVEAAGKRRPEMLRRMREYLENGPSPLPA